MLDRVEAFLGDHIEGFFNRKFSSYLEPVELVKGLEKEIKKQAAGVSLANSYLISLGTEDYQRLCSHRVVDELGVALKKSIIRADLTMDGKLGICFALDDCVRDLIVLLPADCRKQPRRRKRYPVIRWHRPSYWSGRL